VRDDSQQRAEAARTAYDTASLAGDCISLAELANILATVRDELRQDSLAKEIRTNSAADSDIPHLRYPREGLVDQVSNVEALAAEAGSPARAALLTERNELADRQWLGAMKADALAEIERLKQIGRLEASQRDTVTNR
jgi:hypothetical protein